MRQPVNTDKDTGRPWSRCVKQDAPTAGVTEIRGWRSPLLPRNGGIGAVFTKLIFIWILRVLMGVLKSRGGGRAARLCRQNTLEAISCAVAKRDNYQHGIMVDLVHSCEQRLQVYRVVLYNVKLILPETSFTLGTDYPNDIQDCRWHFSLGRPSVFHLFTVLR